MIILRVSLEGTDSDASEKGCLEKGTDAIGNAEKKEEDTQAMIAEAKVPCAEMFFDIKYTLEHKANTPEQRNVAAECTSKYAPRANFFCGKHADDAKGNYRQHHVAAVDPVHLTM